MTLGERKRGERKRLKGEERTVFRASSESTKIKITP